MLSDDLFATCFSDPGIPKSNLTLMTDGKRAETKELVFKHTKEVAVKRVGQGRTPPSIGYNHEGYLGHGSVELGI